MTQKEVQERNKRIALMLCTYDKDTSRFFFEKELWSSITLRCGKRHHEEQLCFHSDWNWLMEAVEFIKNFEKYYPLATDKVCSLMITSKIEEVFVTVSDFASFYNKK